MRNAKKYCPRYETEVFASCAICASLPKAEERNETPEQKEARISIERTWRNCAAESRQKQRDEYDVLHCNPKNIKEKKTPVNNHVASSF